MHGLDEVAIALGTAARLTDRQAVPRDHPAQDAVPGVPVASGCPAAGRPGIADRDAAVIDIRADGLHVRVDFVVLGRVVVLAALRSVAQWTSAGSYKDENDVWRGGVALGSYREVVLRLFTVMDDCRGWGRYQASGAS